MHFLCNLLIISERFFVFFEPILEKFRQSAFFQLLLYIHAIY